MKALITGASSGIGRDMAKELAKKGYDLVIVARDKERLEEVKKEIKTNVETVIMDLSEEENCKKLHEEIKDVDILINNAGFGDFGDFAETSLEKDIKMIKTNILALHILTKLYLKDMKEKNSGVILNVASIAGFMPGPLMATYYSTKSYVFRLSQAIREELTKANSKVKICLLCPGPTKTNFNDVAGVRFGIKSATSEYVARYAINKMLKGKFYIFPGTSIKSIRFLSKVIPDKLIAKITYKNQFSKYADKKK